VLANRFHPLEPYAPGRPIKARDQETAQTVILHPVRNLDPRLAGIFHPSLLTVFAIVEHDGQSLAACEFVPARPLDAVFGGERCHPRRAAQIVSEIADGVAELHGRGIVHGGISSASVLVTAKGRARLSLVSAVGGTEADDVGALITILEGISGKSFGEIRTDSAAVLSALLRA
jgi:serine/threonine protein kinase